MFRGLIMYSGESRVFPFVKQKLLYISGMETERNMDVKAWAQQVIKPAEIENI